jgi:hypothetical protein
LDDRYTGGRIYVENFPEFSASDNWDADDPLVDFWFRTYVRTSSSNYVAIGPWGIYVTGDIALDGLVDGVQVGGMHNEIRAASNAAEYQIMRLQQRCWRLENQVSALARALDVFIIKHATVEEV